MTLRLQRGGIRRRLIARILLEVLVSTIVVWGCKGASEETGAYPMVGSAADCLPDVTLIDQDGHAVSLASLKGKPVLFDFIYTSCPGPCLRLTAQMKQVARQLGGNLGTKVRFVSISVDPEHDRPPQLLTYAKAQGADVDRWLFLTGAPEQIDQFMARFNLRRQREPNGSIDHVLELFLVGADGRPLLQYLAARADAAKIAGDLERVASGGQVVGSAGSPEVRRQSRMAA